MAILAALIAAMLAIATFRKDGVHLLHRSDWQIVRLEFWNHPATLQVLFAGLPSSLADIDPSRTRRGDVIRLAALFNERLIGAKRQHSACHHKLEVRSFP